MNYLKLSLPILFLFLLGCSSSKYQLSQNQSVLLDSTKAYQLVQQCSRFAPTIEGSWNPTVKQIIDMEDNLFKVSELTSMECCLSGMKVNDVNESYRQYVGIVVNGQKFIYINSFPIFEFDDWPQNLKKPDWKTDPYIVCDGGSYYWGVVYNPLTKEFQELAFNGVV